MYRIYTDGACSANGRPDARASYAYVFPDHLQESYAEPLGEDESQTNQMAELLAIYHGSEKAKKRGATSLTIYTDSKYAKDCLCTWYAGWIRKGWKTAEGKPVVHRAILEKIMDVLKSFNSFTITHVPAHTGGSDENSRWNHIADRMAVKALDEKRAISYADLTEPVTPVKAVDLETPPIPGCPLRVMGPPVPEVDLMQYMRTHVDELYKEDPETVSTVFITMLKKMMTKKGFEIEKQTIHKRAMYRLTQKTPCKIQEDAN